MEIYNGELIPSPSEYTHFGRELLSENPDHPGSLGIAISEAIEDALANENTYYSLGSVLNHVMLHQSIIGEELKIQFEMADIEPDMMIGCVGGGSNFAGFAFPFMKDKIDGNSDCEFISVEPSTCPTLTQGKYDYDFGDTEGLTPLLKMFSLGHDFIAPSVHAGGLRYHGLSPQVSLLVKEGLIEPRAAHQDEIFKAGLMFAKSVGIVPAPESTHAIKVAIDEAVKCKSTGEEKTIVFNLSGHGLLDLYGYDKYMNGSLEVDGK
jgi:tryptophan synthase beta chain